MVGLVLPDSGEQIGCGHCLRLAVSILGLHDGRAGPPHGHVDAGNGKAAFFQFGRTGQLGEKRIDVDLAVRGLAGRKG